MYPCKEQKQKYSSEECASAAVISGMDQLDDYYGCEVACFVIMLALFCLYDF